MTPSRGKYIILAFALVAALATIGGYQLNPEEFSKHPTDYLYRVLQLFALEGDWTSGAELNLWLELARFFAPVVTVGSLLLLFAEGIWTMLVNSQIRTFRDHIVIVGASDSALVLIRDCRSRGLKVVVIDDNPENPTLNQCRSMRIPVINGDPFSRSVLKRSRVYKAKSLLTFLDNDDQSVELSLRVQALVNDRRSEAVPPLKVILQIDDMQLGGRLESYPKFFELPQKMEVRFFNQQAQAARFLFQDYAPEVYADALGEPHVHVVILGYSALGRHILMASLRQAHYRSEAPVSVTVLSENLADASAAFQRQCPAMSITASVRFHEIELAPEVLRDQIGNLMIDNATMFVCCHGSDSDNMSLALALREMTLVAIIPNAPIMVALRNSQGLARLVETGDHGPEIPDGLYPFGTVDQLMRVDQIINEKTDFLAIAIHSNFLKLVGDSPANQPSHRPWGLLPESFRNYNRSQADHIPAKLRAVGCVLHNSTTALEFSQEELEVLARMEKRRWNAEHASLGWTHAEHRSDFAKVHPLLKSWDRCSLEERTYDLESMRGLPTLLKEELGLGIAREIIIGISGHRAHRILDHHDALLEAISETLLEIAQAYPDAQFSVLSALADGSDRMVAREAMRLLEARLIAVLPLPYEIYKRSFGHDGVISNDASNLEFQELVGVADRYFELPLRFGGVQILERDDEVGEKARARQYALAGAYIACRSHEMLAIWDGKAARGIGGTAEIVEWRDRGRVPDEYYTPNHYFPEVDMKKTHVIDMPAA